MTRSKVSSYITLCVMTLTFSQQYTFCFGFFDNRHRAEEVIARQDQLERQARIEAEERRLNEQDARAWENFCEMWTGDAGTIIGGVVCGLFGIGLVVVGGSLIASRGSSSQAKIR